MSITLDGSLGFINANGTSSGPSLTGQDSDTGVYFGTNIVGLSTDGTSRLRSEEHTSELQSH